MSGANVEDVGMRLVLQGASVYLRKIEQITAAQEKLNEAMAASVDASAKATAASDKQTAALADQAKVAKVGAAEQIAAKDAVVAGATEQSAAIAAASREQAAAAALASRNESLAIAARARGWKATSAIAGKVLKWGSAAALGIGYEGIKGFQGLQQQVAQLNIEAGVSKSQLPALFGGILKISNATGLAASGTQSVADQIFRLASANPALHSTTAELIAMGKQAANLHVLSGPQSNADAIARTYGAIVSNNLAIRRGAAPLSYNSASGRSINAWALAVAGHGDVKLSQIPSSLGTGILPIAKAAGISLNQLGAGLDVLYPSMSAAAAATRLKTGIGMAVSPSQQAAYFMSAAGGNRLTMMHAAQSGGITGMMSQLHHMLTVPLTGKNFYSKFYGNGLGTFAGGKGGTPTGQIAELRALQFSPQQIAQAIKGGISSVPGMAADVVIHMFGAGHSGAAIYQLYQAAMSGELGNKLKGIRQGERSSTYQSALRSAYAEPIVAFHKFESQLKNFTIIVGKDITPAFDGFLSDLESLGKWFGANRWALKSLEYMGGAALLGAAGVKAINVAGAAYKGGTQLIRTILHPILSVKSGFGQAAGLNGAAASLKGSAVSLDEAAAALKDAAIGGGILPGGAAKIPEEGAAAATFGARAGAALRTFATAAFGVGLGVAGGAFGATELFKIPAVRHFESSGGFRPVPYNVTARAFNFLDTLGNVATAGMYHPHLNNLLSQMSAVQMLSHARSWGHVKGTMTSAQRSTLENYWGYAMGNPKSPMAAGLTTQQRAVLGAEGHGAIFGGSAAHADAAATHLDQSAARLEAAAQALGLAAGSVGVIANPSTVYKRTVTGAKNHRARR